LATNSSRKLSKASRKSTAGASETVNVAAVHELLLLHKISTALPWAVFSAEGTLKIANSRALGLFELEKAPAEGWSLSQWEKKWPFFTEEASPQALSKDLLKHSTAKQLFAEGRLKTWKLQVIPLKLQPDSKPLRLMVFELLRRGDLLKEAGSKKALFRTLSHEIRTSVQALKGYVEMVGVDPERDAMVKDRMRHAISRLEAVIGRLSEFKEELGVDV
jgi:signal transduction histidine kinase